MRLIATIFILWTLSVLSFPSIVTAGEVIDGHDGGLRDAVPPGNPTFNSHYPLGFGDDVGAKFEVPTSHDRNASALFGSILTDDIGRIEEDEIQRRREDINEVFVGQDDDKRNYQVALQRQNTRVREIISEDVQGRRDRQFSALQDQRQAALALLLSYEQYAGQDGEWTDAENAEYWKRYTHLLTVLQPTQDEQAAMAASQEVRDDVLARIRTGAINLGGVSAEDIADRGPTADLTYTKVFFTGQAASMVQEDIHNQREKGIWATNMILAAEIFLQDPNITDEERAAAEQVLTASTLARGAAAEAIVADAGVIVTGAAFDVLTLGAGRPASFVGGKVRQALNPLLGEAGTQVGIQAGSQLGRTGGTEGGATARGAGTEAGAAARGAGAETAGTTQKLSGETQEGLRLLDEAEQVGDGLIRGLSETQILGGNTVMLPLGSQIPGSAASAAQTVVSEVGSLSRNLTQAQIDDLFRPFANLSSEQLLIKTDLLLARQALRRSILEGAREAAEANASSGAANIGAPPVVNPGAGGGLTPPTGFNPAASGATFVDDAGRVAQSALDDGATASFPQTLLTPGLPPSGTVNYSGAITLPQATSGAGAVGSKTAAFDGALTIPQAAGQRIGAPTASQIQNAENVLKSLETIAKEPLGKAAGATTTRTVAGPVSKTTQSNADFTQEEADALRGLASLEGSVAATILGPDQK